MNDNEIKNLAEYGYFLGHTLHADIEETHISWVILTKKFAFKIKKPVKLSFLDFSTLAKRQKYCSRELELNRRFSPIYLNVLPVRNENHAWHIGRGPGIIVDYAVQMKRLMFSKRMDKLLMAGNVTRSHIVALAKVIGSFHAKASVVNLPFNLPEARRTFNDIRTLKRLSRIHLGDVYADIIQKSIEWSDDFLRTFAGRIRERTEQGFVRDVHGDLHSGNIFLYKTPVLFDCIEFNDNYRHIDVLSEIAFLCMDLEAYGKGSFARLFLQSYQQRMNCFQSKEDKMIFRYYKCFRANVRAKVHALAAQQAHDAEIYQHHVSSWKTYLRLMKRYMVV